MYDFSVFCRGNADRLGEKFCKIDGVSDAHFGGYFGDGKCRVGKQLFCLFDTHEIDVAHGAYVELFFELMQEITFIHKAHF